MSHLPHSSNPEEEPSMTLSGVSLIAAERERQVAVEAWSSAHDDQYVDGELTAAAMSYTFAARHLEGVLNMRPDPPRGWPWARAWWKPSEDPVRNLVKAGALIAAEIDRLQRVQPDDA